MTYIRRGVFLVAVLALAGCGTQTGERTVSGAGIGAAAGAVGAAIFSGPIGGAALIGSAAGAALGGLSDPDKINLGKPAWQQ